jgi:ecotropic viral integration site 5 protein
MVFRIYDSCLASGIEAIFGFSIALLKRNEEALLSLKFDQILLFFKSHILDQYVVSADYFCPVNRKLYANFTHQLKPASEGSEATYRVDEFVQEAYALNITPFMLDSFAHEYEDLMRTRDAHKNEIAALQQHNRILLAQTYV